MRSEFSYKHFWRVRDILEMNKFKPNEEIGILCVASFPCVRAVLETRQFGNKTPNECQPVACSLRSLNAAEM